ncbi:hypothetical protein K490DRAFT_63219 [Saccharata proteae CBS 121410]|uniref:Vacuolar ATPase assembly protein VMA22 n=1 Tax=Saccharata proteae CBS 121410 TaxID=1314787 RepID=A0A9P4LYV0_9PEZI|nr:hypothetical protein K490DRAFT_63219 [Saccharata proteae CBS 121410]
MSETTQLPQETIQASASDKESLLDALDDLLKRYLDLLDQYQQAREQLSSRLAKGYISIAQANFNAPNRARYGQDFYDERMQAIRTVSVDESRSVLKRTIVSTAKKVEGSVPADNEDGPEVEHTSTSTEKLMKEDNKPTDIAGKDEPVSETDPACGVNQPQKESKKPEPGAASEESKKSEKSTESAEKHVDPIKWFGILVPPALRTAQKHFVGVVEESVPDVTNLSDELRSIEIEIGRTRKKIRKLDNRV